MMTLDQVYEKVQLAGVYAEDGAFFSGARLLREAADMLQTLAEEDRKALEDFAAEKR